MKKIILPFSLVVLFFSSFNPLHAQAPATAPNIAGSYSVTGTNPGNTGRYRGTATIIKEGDKYRMHWNVGTTYDGIGSLNGNTFTVEWGTTTSHVGTVTYVLGKDGVMKGTWYEAKTPNNLGTEILTPQK